MAYLFLFLLFLTPSMAMADLLSPDNGVRAPQSMMVSGNSVIDSKSEEEKPSVTEGSSGEDAPVAKLLMDDADTLGKDDAYATPASMPIDPFAPAPKPVTTQSVKKVLKTIPTVKAQRSIADDRIDDGYVQGLIKNNSTFTPAID